MSNFDEDLSRLSSAEDFFTYFGLAYDAQIMAASRLHILKLFHNNLDAIEGLDTFGEEEKRAAYRKELVAAYQRFVAGNALTERVFPKLQAAKGAFVALSSLTKTHKSSRQFTS